MVKESHTVPPQDKPIRLSDYVPGIFESISSKKGMKKAIEKKLVFVNGTAGLTSKYINGGELIELRVDPTENHRPSISVDLEVLYEDEYLAIIHKPAGIVVSGNKRRTIENALPRNLKKSNRPDALTRPQAIHRLDYPTSGVLLIGKTSNTITALNKLFEERKVTKTYLAISIGKMSLDKETIETLIKSKKAKTEYQVLKSVESKRFGQLNLVKLNPITGRRHQIRIHLSNLGHPILGDSEYGKEDLILKGKGLFLHSSAIEFIHPISGDQISVEATTPKKFDKIFG